ncbi:hypothetical protein ABIE26_002845 [Pedobacter africanus]|uniref:Uncharacterized protein n=1 Tax=Pedobacter africanus TaxID=151894 RepID=A0ACC6KXG5_9SPHI|nr:hypothetical protein [Pedobacter africanus]MDR6783766.1 hypothetical protein [Pedobacter africanus]
MNKEQYPYLINPNKISFEFVSRGPKGDIRKQVRYTARDPGDFIFNLGFGDLNELNDQLDDFTISNNGDRDKVLATVAATLLEFTTQFPQAFVYAQGSTATRTRLYQMAITQNLEEIEKRLYIHGLKNGTWSKFVVGVNYEAFMVLSK